MKYYIVREDPAGCKFYKKNKTVDGWSGEPFRPYCWRFSKQGAKKICDRLNAINPYFKYYYIPVED